MEIEGTERIGMVAAEMLDRAFAAEIPEEAASAEIGAVMVIAEVTVEEEGDEPGYTHVFYRCSDPRRWVQRGLLREAIDSTRTS